MSDRPAFRAGRDVPVTVELGLSRIADGGYGRCRVGDVQVLLAVLQAVPQTTMGLSWLHVAGGRR